MLITLLLTFAVAGPLMTGDQSSSPSQQFRPSDFTPGAVGGSGSGSCASIPASVRNAVTEALQFQRQCSQLSGFESSGKKIAINDYSGTTTPPRMYIFDSTGANCLKSVPISYGGGGRRVAPPKHCAGSGQKFSPAGIHVTSNHFGARYSGSNAIGMVGMSGQGSVGRGVIMHPVKYQAGGPSTWGCTGMTPQDFAEVRDMLGTGSMVNNYFGSTGSAPGCKNSAGALRPPNGSSCRKDPGGAGRFSYGSESPSGPRTRNPRGAIR
jgi:hypothetical protein